MTVEVFAIRFKVNVGGRDRYAYLSSITKSKDTQNYAIRVSHNKDETDKFEDPEIQDSCAMFFSRRQAINVRDFVAAKLADASPTSSAHKTIIDVVPQQVGYDIAALILTQPQIDTSL